MVLTTALQITLLVVLAFNFFVYSFATRFAMSLDTQDLGLQQSATDHHTTSLPVKGLLGSLVLTRKCTVNTKENAQEGAVHLYRKLTTIASLLE